MKSLYSTDFSIGEYVNVNICGSEIKFCQVTAVKFDEHGVKFDLLLSNGQKIYDINYEAVTSIAEQANNLSKTEISNI